MVRLYINRYMGTYICKICNQHFLKKGFGSHIHNKHNMNSKEYYDMFIKKEGEGICLECENNTSFNNIIKGYSKFCSCKCAQSSIITKEKQSRVHLGKKRPDMIGYLNVAKRPEVRKKISEKAKGRIITKETKEKLSISISKALAGKSYEERHGKKVADKLKEIRRQEMLNGKAQDMCSKIVSPSKPQLELYEMVKSIFSNAQLEYRVENYSFDIAIPEKKLDIEYDCSYWHTKEKDEKRDKFAKLKGWKVIRFIDRLPTMNELMQHCQQT